MHAVSGSTEITAISFIVSVSLVDVWQSAAEHNWCSYQRVKKVTASMHACRWSTFWTLVVSLSWDWKSHRQIK